MHSRPAAALRVRLTLLRAGMQPAAGHTDTVAPWVEEGAPILLVGPRGAGKALLARHAVGAR